MAGLGNNLYPPIFKKSYMPAFAREDQKCRIYFALSSYNSLEDLFIYGGKPVNSNKKADLVQVSIQNQNTNYSALNFEKYPSGIMTTSMYEDKNRVGEDRYYIEIICNPDSEKCDLAPGNVFNSGEFYKVQIRFTQAGTTAPPSGKIKMSWFTQNLASFSEWSQVVLVKGIQKPTIKLNDFVKDSQGIYFTLQDIYIVGKVIFNPKDNQYLKKYCIKVLEKDTGKEIENSGWRYSNSYSNINSINYKLKYDFKKELEADATQYELKISIQTNNLYEAENLYLFKVNLIEYTTLDSSLQINVSRDIYNGKLKVSLTSKDLVKQLGTNLIIRRASSKDNFEHWEDMYIFLAPLNKVINQTWFDKTVESGVWYKYSVQQRNMQGFRSNFIQTQPILAYFEEIFLIDNQQQLKVKFDPQVNNYSHVVSQSLTQTIGSKYPFIRRNGNMDYRTFTLNGTITHFMNTRDNGMKASREDLYGENYQKYYKKYNDRNNINNYNDSVYQRDFRQKVIQFLYRNTVKLYKSTTEGNMLVKLMNISFTPNNTLSRHIYSFSCTVQEVDEFNTENCDKYGIQSMGTFVNETRTSIYRHGQIIVPNLNKYFASSPRCFKEVMLNDADMVEESFAGGESKKDYRTETYVNRKVCGLPSELHFGDQHENIITSYILPKYQNLGNKKIKISISHLRYLRIEFTSAPYLIIDNGNNTFKKKTQEDNVFKEAILGHLIYINGEPVIVNPEGIYELADETTEVKELNFSFNSETAFISYEAVVIQEVREENIPKSYENLTRIGQFFGYFNSSDSIFKKIYLKYYQTFSNTTSTETKKVYVQEMQHIMGLRIYANPGTAFLVKEKIDSNYDYFIMNDTGLLEFFDDKTDIAGFYIIGPQLQDVTEYEEDDQHGRFKYKNGKYERMSELEERIPGQHYYKIKEIEDKELKDNEYTLTEGNFNSFEDIQNPKRNHVYSLEDENALRILASKFYDTDQLNMLGALVEEPEEVAVLDYQTLLINKQLVGEKYCIFYNGSWFLFSLSEGIVLGCPNEAIIDYYCQILKERY